MPDTSTSAYPYLEEALPGFHRGWVLVKAVGDSLAGRGFIGTKFDFYRFANRLRFAVCIHHIFAQRHLTANPYRQPSVNLIIICCALNHFLLDFIRDGFLRRVQLAEASGVSKA